MNLVEKAENAIYSTFGRNNIVSTFEEDGWACALGLVQTHKKEFVVYAVFPVQKVDTQKASEVFRKLESDVDFFGKLTISIENPEIFIVKYSRQVCSCFGIKNRAANYENLISQTIDLFISKCSEFIVKGD